MLRTRLRNHHLQGFTLIEMIVAIGIMAIIAAIAVPPWHNYHSRIVAYEAANNLRSDLQLLFALSQQKESSYSFAYDSGSNSYTVKRYSMTSAADKDKNSTGLDSRPVKTVSLNNSNVNLGLVNFKIVTGQQGWIDVANCSGISPKEVNGFNAYVISIDLPGIMSIPVRVFQNGKVEVG